MYCLKRKLLAAITVCFVGTDLAEAAADFTIIDFSDVQVNGSVTTNTLSFNGVIISGSGPLDFDSNGVAIIGGISNQFVDTSEIAPGVFLNEFVEFTAQADCLFTSFNTGGGVYQDGDNFPLQAPINSFLVEGFSEDGSLVGAIDYTDTGSDLIPQVDYVLLFGGTPLKSVRVTSVGDRFRLNSLLVSTEASPTVPEPSSLVVSGILLAMLLGRHKPQWLQSR